MLGRLNKKLNYDGRFLLGQDLDLTSDETDTILFSGMGAILAVVSGSRSTLLRHKLVNSVVDLGLQKRVHFSRPFGDSS